MTGLVVFLFVVVIVALWGGAVRFEKIEQRIRDLETKQ